MMNKLLIVLITITSCSMLAPIDVDEARQWYAEMDILISKWEHGENKIEKLDEALYKFGKRCPHPDPRWNELYFRVQRMMLQKPNYINYFTEKIETERAKVGEYHRNSNEPYHTGERNNFNSLRFYIIEETLCHLPSPPTVAALGKYLYDERDTPPPMKPGQDWIDNESNAYLACKALAKIGLRNAPVPPRVAPDESHLATWRLWWEQVQAGTRSFSFEGEAVEYRFRKDGTWETSTWKNESLHVSDNSTTHRVAEVFASSHNRWLMVLTGILLGIAWLRWKKHGRMIK